VPVRRADFMRAKPPRICCRELVDVLAEQAY